MIILLMNICFAYIYILYEFGIGRHVSCIAKIDCAIMLILSKTYKILPDRAGLVTFYTFSQNEKMVTLSSSL